MARREGREAALAYIYHTPECISQKTYKDPCKTCVYGRFWGAEETDRIWESNRKMSAVPVTEAMVLESSLFRFLKTVKSVTFDAGR